MIFDAHPVLAWLNRLAYRRIDKIIVLGESLRRIFDGMVDPARLEVVENFVDEHAFASEEEIRQKCTGSGPIRVVFLSNFLPDKGYREAARAIAFLSGTLDIEATFIGDFTDSSSRDEFLTETRACRSIRYLGPLGLERFAYLRECHVFLLPTQYIPEGQPISILEAYASGTFVITTGCGGIPDIFRDGVNGFQVKPGSAEDIAEKLKRYAVLPPEGRLAVALWNQGEAHRRFSTSAHLARMHNLLGVPQSGSLHNADPAGRLAT
jgi:glycosyltransferase involved in cell wall biosynthesis